MREWLKTHLRGLISLVILAALFLVLMPVAMEDLGKFKPGDIAISVILMPDIRMTLYIAIITLTFIYLYIKLEAKVNA